MTVTKQEFSLVTNAAWNGDGVSTGIMGLAYPGLTRVYNGTNPNKDVRNHTEVYNPLFFTAVSEKVVSNPCEFLTRTYRRLKAAYIISIRLLRCDQQRKLKKRRGIHL